MATFNLKEYTKKLDDWALIQSDPGVQGRRCQVQELYTLDFDELMEGPFHGLIFASKYTEDEDEGEYEGEADESNDDDAQDIIFTKQIITNVCATLALVAVLFNGGLQLGSILSDFKELTANMSPEERGTALGDCEEIKRVHNSYDVPDPLAEVEIKNLVEEVVEDDMEYVDAENYHYIAYIPKNNFLWEIDGLQEKPKKLCVIGDSSWLEKVKPYIEERMAAQGDELTFNLMAITDNRDKKSLKAFKKIKDFFIQCQKSIKKSNDCSGMAAAVEQLKCTIHQGTKHYNFALPVLQAIENNDCNTCKDALSELSPVLESRVKEIKDRKYDEDQKQKEVNQQKTNYRRFIQKLSKAIPKIEQKQQKANAIKDKKLMKAKPPKRSPLTKRQKTLLFCGNDASLDPVKSSANFPVPIDDAATSAYVSSILDINSAVEDIALVSTDKNVSTTTDIPVVADIAEAKVVTAPKIPIGTGEHPMDVVTTAASTHSDHMDNHCTSMKKISIFTDNEDSDMAEPADFGLPDTAISVAHVTDDFRSIPIAKDTFFTDIDSDYFNEVIKVLLSKVTPTSASPSSVSAEIATSVAIEYFSHSPVGSITASPPSPNAASSPSSIDECSLDQLPRPAVDHKRRLIDDEEHPISGRPKKAKTTAIKSQGTKQKSVSNISPPSKKMCGTRRKRMGNEE
ncbi:hypothetical protein BDB01DRAFT_839247 [Pilobolus umbonatus]|nr:hypothetical protein BDB01DRAFT_839247 [Pilobolus umbonatus]